MVDEQERDVHAIPRPIGRVGRYCAETDPCAADSPTWGAEYQAALEEATERASKIIGRHAKRSA